MKYFPIEGVENFTAAILLSRGVSGKNATYIAEMAVRTEAMGITTHGLSVIQYLDQQIPELLNPVTEPEVIKDMGAVALIDGKMGFSQIAMKKAIALALEKAERLGVAMVGIRNTHWLGALGPFLEKIARAGYMTQLWGQSSQCSDCAPVGGIVGKFSTNPVAMAFPTLGNPVIADISTSAISMGAAARMAKNGEKAMTRIFMNKAGQATDDPQVAMDDGSIFFLGGQEYGHKGYGLSLWIEALTAMAGGSSNNPDLPQTQNLNLTIINIDAFSGRKYYEREVTRFISYMKDNRLRPGYNEILLPGERAFRSIAQAESRGLPVDESKLEKLNEIAGKNGVDILE